MKGLTAVFYLFATLEGLSALSDNDKNFRFRYKSRSVLSWSNQRLVIECPIQATFYMWRVYETSNNGDNKPVDSRALLDQDSKELVIERASISNSGIYQCKSTTGFDNIVTNITTVVIDPNDSSTKNRCVLFRDKSTYQGLCFTSQVSIPSQQYKTNDEVILDCNAAATLNKTNRQYPQISNSMDLTYSWYFQPYLPSSGSNNQFTPIWSHLTNVSHVIIPQLNNPTLQGTYRCQVSIASTINKLPTNSLNRPISLTRIFPVLINNKLDDSSSSSANTDLIIAGPTRLNITLKSSDGGITAHPVLLNCDVSSNTGKIHSIKWGKRISSKFPSTISSPKIVTWDSHNYRLLPPHLISEQSSSIAGGSRSYLNSTLTLTQDPNLFLFSQLTGSYICVAMSTRGLTTHKLFNVLPYPLPDTSSSFNSDSNNNIKLQHHNNPFIVLYIVLPAIVIFFMLSLVIFCCIKDRQRRFNNTTNKQVIYQPTSCNTTKSPITNNNNNNCHSLPMKHYPSSISDTNYYYPVNQQHYPLSSSSSSTNHHLQPQHLSVLPPHFPTTTTTTTTTSNTTPNSSNIIQQQQHHQLLQLQHPDSSSPNTNSMML